MSGRNFFAGVDIGGTFTDVILAEEDTHTLYASKALTTYDDPSKGVIAALQDAMDEAGAVPASIQRVVHATTLATNLILEGKGAKVGYVATEGFGDVIQMGRGKRVGIERFDLFHERPEPPVTRRMTVEARERLNYRGEVLTPLDEPRMADDLQALAALRPESVAVCLMHAYANPEHEQKVAAAIRNVLPDAYVALSSEVWPEFREYERATTTVMSAYVGPLMSTYVARLEAELTRLGVSGALHIMHSSGGVMTAAA
jgi:N-methylhydantoinase A